MEEYKGYYVEERWGTPGLIPQEVVIYPDQPSMTRGNYVTTSPSFEAARAWIDQQIEEMPGVEFEGPMGRFYGPDEVSVNALVKGAVEIVNAMVAKGVSSLDVVKMIREKGGQI